MSKKIKETSRRNLIKLSIKSISLVKSVAGILSTLLVAKIFIELINNINITPAATWLFIQFTVIIYFLSWVQAALKGIETQSILLNSTADKEGKMPFAGYFALSIGVPIGSAIMALVLYKDQLSPFITNLMKISTMDLMVYLLSAFWLWDMFWHISVRQTMRQMIKKSKDNIRNDFGESSELEQVNALEFFMLGQWRFLRITFGILVMLFLIYISTTNNGIIQIPIITNSINKDSFLAILIFLFVMISEGWIWILRHRLLITIDVINSLDKKYTLTRHYPNN